MSTINQEDLTAGAGLIVNGLQMDLIIFLQIVESLWEAELVVLTLSSELLTVKYQRIVNIGSLLLSSAQNKTFKTQLQIRKCSNLRRTPFCPPLVMSQLVILILTIHYPDLTTICTKEMFLLVLLLLEA